MGDITQVDETTIPAHDILCAGFPCQEFSISGKQKGFEDTRGTLFFDIVRIVDYHQPKLLILENVKNFAKHDKGNTLKTVLNVLAEMGYDVSYQILNASHFGLPQNREQVYFVWFRQDLAAQHFSFPQLQAAATALQDFLQNNPKEAEVIQRPDINIKK